MPGPSGSEPDDATLAAVRILADTELRARQAAATEAQVAEAKETNRLIGQLVDILRTIAAQGNLARHIYDGIPPWGRAAIFILFSLSMVGLSSNEIMEVLRVFFPSLAAASGGGGAPALSAP